MYVCIMYVDKTQKQRPLPPVHTCIPHIRNPKGTEVELWHWKSKKSEKTKKTRDRQMEN